MRIGIVCFAAIGGSSTVAASLASRLVSAGDFVVVLAPALPPRLRRESGVVFRAVPEAGHPLRPGSAEEIRRLAEALAQAVADDRLDLLHAHYAHPHAVAAVAARERLPAARRPTVVTTLHGSDVTECPSVAAALRGSDGVSAVSAFLADAAAAVYGIPRPVVIDNFLDDDSLRRVRGRARRCGFEEERVLLHVSTLRPVKRAVDCIGILARVRRQLPCRLLVVGDGPDAAAMRAEATRVGLADAVHLVGATADVGAYLDQADLLLCPSASESFGMAALEAMAAGVPVVGSRVGGLTEVVAEDICGRLLPVGDLDGMAEAACQILLQPDLAAAYAEAGQRIARTRFSPDNAIAAYRGLYAATRAGRGTQPLKGAT
jgi:N-acetyl-alpha-D-glucosaminyl L-malate synthase BshA